MSSKKPAGNEIRVVVRHPRNGDQRPGDWKAAGPAGAGLFGEGAGVSPALSGPGADGRSRLTPFPTDRQRAVSCLSQPEHRGAKTKWNLPKIWEGRMKLKSYSRVQAFFCYFNPVIGAMSSC